jgi:hypothetical protein
LWEGITIRKSTTPDQELPKTEKFLVSAEELSWLEGALRVNCENDCSVKTTAVLYR